MMTCGNGVAGSYGLWLLASFFTPISCQVVLNFIGASNSKQKQAKAGKQVLFKKSWTKKQRRSVAKKHACDGDDEQCDQIGLFL